MKIRNPQPDGLIVSFDLDEVFVTGSQKPGDGLDDGIGSHRNALRGHIHIGFEVALIAPENSPAARVETHMVAHRALGKRISGVHRTKARARRLRTRSRPRRTYLSTRSDTVRRSAIRAVRTKRRKPTTYKPLPAQTSSSCYFCSEAQPGLAEPNDKYKVYTAHFQAQKTWPAKIRGKAFSEKRPNAPNGSPRTSAQNGSPPARGTTERQGKPSVPAGLRPAESAGQDIASEQSDSEFRRSANGCEIPLRKIRLLCILFSSKK